MIITFVNANMGFGGAERVISILSNQLVKAGHVVRIGIFNTKMSESVYPLEESIRLDWIPHFHYNSIKNIIKTNHSIKQYLRETRPDIVICFMNNICAQFSVICRQLHIPLVFSERNDPSRFIVSKKDKLLQKLMLQNIKYAVFQTSGAMQMYPERIQKKSIVILNPIDTHRTVQNDHVEKKKEVITIGRLEPQKNQRILIEAFAKVSINNPDYILRIYGEGSLKKELCKIIFELGMDNKIFLMGNTDNIDEKLCESSLFVLTSDFEGLPNALIEAMALGLPCISTDCSPGGARELIEDGVNGFIIPCGDIQKLSEYLELLMNDSTLRAKLGNNAVNIINRINAETITCQWEEYLEGVKYDSTKSSKRLN